MCQNHHPLCRDTSDDTHECPRRTPPTEPAEQLRSLMRALALADDDRAGITLSVSDVHVLCRALRLASIMDGAAILYAIENPTLSLREARLRAGMELCARCRGVVTPSNRAIHENGECWPVGRAS